MNVACDYEAPMQMLTTEKYIAVIYTVNRIDEVFLSFNKQYLFRWLENHNFTCQTFIFHFISLYLGSTKDKNTKSTH